MTEPSASAVQRILGPRATALLTRRELPAWLALASTLLLAPTLFIGFHLDDYVHRYLFSGLPGSADLLRAYQSPFGIANGEVASNQWQIEAGYAPWWTYPRLLISLWRPLSAFTHWLDAACWPSSAWLQHAHSLGWHFALVLCAARLYRAVLGPTTVAGLAAVLYAFDQTHGFPTGWIANRNALVAAFFGIAALLCHVDARRAGERALGRSLLATLLFACALAAGEGAIAIFGYLCGYAVFVDGAPLKRRLLSLAPYALVIVGWRLAYNLLGRGAAFSGLYLDPVREPLRFAAALLERVPLLVLGQLALPPAETYLFVPPLWAQAIWLLGLAVALWSLISLLPLVRIDGVARFWLFGTLLSLAPACTTHPNNRLLFFVGIGAMALLSQLWHGLVTEASWARGGGAWRALARAFAVLAVGFHLFLSPLLLPFSGCSIAITGSAEAAAHSALEQARGRELVIVSSPDYFFVKLLPVLAALESRTPPRALRALSFGAVPLRITRSDAHTLEIVFEGGLLGSPLLELYRRRNLVMERGSRVRLQDLEIEVTALTSDGRIGGARFRFDKALEDASLCWLCWSETGYRAFNVPAIGERMQVPAARLLFAERRGE